jgi:hypothetical protein
MQTIIALILSIALNVGVDGNQFVCYFLGLAAGGLCCTYVYEAEEENK